MPDTVPGIYTKTASSICHADDGHPCETKALINQLIFPHHRFGIRLPRIRPPHSE